MHVVARIRKESLGRAPGYHYIKEGAAMRLGVRQLIYTHQQGKPRKPAVVREC